MESITLLNRNELKEIIAGCEQYLTIAGCTCQIQSCEGELYLIGPGEYSIETCCGTVFTEAELAGNCQGSCPF